ncbi:MAG: hypothetical protein OXC10_01335 [Rhodospirillaceae bacterium]|nr:hypothetical protein [Rhodospirillaceae bacterium]
MADAIAVIDAVTNITTGIADSERLATAVAAVGVDDRRPGCHPLHLRGAYRRGCRASPPHDPRHLCRGW